MWTLAAAALTRTDLPDEIPAAYKHRGPGLLTLTDHRPPDVSARQLESARRFAAESVADLNSRLFPRHGLPA
jgi:hypothetical protein